MTKESIVEKVWEEHKDNRDHSHELERQFCRACIDRTYDLTKDEVEKEWRNKDEYTDYEKRILKQAKKDERQAVLDEVVQKLYYDGCPKGKKDYRPHEWKLHICVNCGCGISEILAALAEKKERKK